MQHTSLVTSITRAASVVGALALCVSMAACGSGSPDGSASASSSSSASAKLPKLEGVKLTGTPGKKPKVEFKKGLKIENNSVAVLQEGDGDAMKSGDRICAQLTQYSASSGEEVATTWEQNVPDCSLVFNPENGVTSVESATLAQIANTTFKGKKLNTTIGIGINDGSGNDNAYMLIMTPVSQSKDYTKAEGEQVKDIPSDLPKVTLDSAGKPSIDMNGYKGSDKLVVQPLIKGDGPKIDENTYAAVVNYTGWTLDGKQFDSSWDRNQTFDAVLSNMIKGWQEGLVGQTVGSQVLLVVPPDLGYGDQEQGEIPANSTLVFVVDILAKY
ncbi:FKBP-type peptidyl-prolyl cis-trans isomerase [Bifidobacterium sp. AGR2158]|uniref:FKBP-type peptidyl-prolyl cis-trans isomerase n=1 Tax=Bifidobacterium sp. AGR2158 TaxID=1280675 RepID=UPI00047C4E56|nr:FKBP-type peptidyl-prolyl cis-trans isomerase [Bifidobacterium sp. AGR2158]